MLTGRIILTFVCAVLGLLAQAGIANAQATRTWVSGVGDDVNPCSRTAPCKTFAGAISKTAANGSINVLDPGGFGAVTITKSISIVSEFEAGVLVSGTNGIIVNVGANDRVLLDGLDIEGINTGLNGIRMVGGGRLTVRKSKIRNFSVSGVDVAGAAGARVVIDECAILNNGIGIKVQGAGGAANGALVQRSLVDSNATAALQAIGAGNSLSYSASFILNSATALDAQMGAAIVSYGGTSVVTGSGMPNNTLPLK